MTEGAGDAANFPVLEKTREKVIFHLRDVVTMAAIADLEDVARGGILLFLLVFVRSFEFRFDARFSFAFALFY